LALSAGLFLGADSGAINYPLGHFDPVGLTLTSGASRGGDLYSSKLSLTAAGGGAFTPTLQTVSQYQAEFTVQLPASGSGGAAFVLQDSSASASGGGLAGYEGIGGKSIAVGLTSDGTNAGKVRLGVNGNWVEAISPSGGVDLRGRPVLVQVVDDGTRLKVTLTDLSSLTSGSTKTGSVTFATAASAATTFPTGKAYAGLTGVNGDVLQWQFSSALPAASSIGGATGSLTARGDSYTLAGSGTGLGSSAAGDSLFAATRTITADQATVEATVGAASDTAARGLVLTTSGAVGAAVYVQNGKAYFASRYTSDAAASVSGGISVAGDTRLRLVRNDRSVAGYALVGGKWTLVGTGAVVGVSGATGLASPAVGLAVWSGSSAQASGGFSAVTTTENQPLGADTGAAGTQSRDTTGLWQDVINQADAWLKPDKSGLAAVDAQGNPTEDFRTRVMTPLWNTLGTYHLTLTTGPNANPQLQAYYATITNQSFNASTGVFAADLTYTRGNGDADIILTGLDGGARDIHMYRPGYGPGTGTITNEYASYLSKLGVRAIRTMNLTETNDNPVRTWSERTLPTDVTQLQTRPLRRMDGSSPGNVMKKKGAAWESVVEVANRAHADLWINVPAQADDNYVQQLANLIKIGSTVGGKYYPGLDPDLNLYVEYSNEVWNPGFDAYHWAEDHAKAEIAAADASGTTADVDYDHLDRTQPGTPSVWALRWYARRLAQVSNIFKGVFGDRAMNTRIRPVLSNRPFKGQYEDMLAFVNRFVAPPSSLFYALGTIPYVNMNGPNNTQNLWNGGNDNPNLTPDQVLQTLALNSQALTSQYVQFRDISNRYGIKMVAYEAGTDTSGYLAQDARATAQRDPRITSLLESYTQNWFAHGGSLMMYFTADVGAYGRQSGDFRLAEEVTQLGGAKTVGYRLSSDAERSVPAPLEPYELRTSTGADSASVNLSWKQPATGTQPIAFEIERATDSNFKQNDVLTLANVMGSAMNYTVTGLQPGTLYYFRVRAVAPSGKSEPAAYAQRTTSGTATAPLAPTGVAVTAVSNSQVHVTWTNVSDNETGYQVQIATDSGFSSVVRDLTKSASALGDPTSADGFGLDSGTTYFARVRSVGSGGASAWVNAGSATTAALSPIAAYSFEEADGSTSILDAVSVGGNANGTLVGGTRLASGFSGRAIQLDGSNSYVDLGKPGKLNVAGQFTVSAWVKPNPQTGKADVAIQDWDGVNTPWYLRVEDANTVVFGSYHYRYFGAPANEARGQIPYTLTDGQWHHLAGTYDGEQFVVYVDGVKIASQADAYGVSRGTQPVNLGRNSNYGGGSRDYLNGALDEVKFFNTGLSPADVAKLAAGAKPGTGTPTVPTTTVDNKSGAFSYTGRWWSSASIGGYFGGDYLNDGNTNKSGTTGTWKLSPTKAGTYAVFARWVTASNSAGSVSYDVTTADGVVTVNVDQSKNGGTWRLLGTFKLDPATAQVTIRNAGTSGLVVADAVGFAASSAPTGTNSDPAGNPPPPTTIPTGPSGYTYVTGENGTATYSSPTDLAYGANGKFNYKYGFTGTIKFDNATFGDPIPGVGKYGFSRPSGSTTPPATGPTGPSGFTYAVGENQSYTFTSPVDVAYGANGQFNYKYGVTGTVSFNNATFGDPIPGTYKSGFFRAASGTGTTSSGPALVLDNRDSAFAFTGRWWYSTSPAGYVGSEYLNNGNTGQGTTSATWTPGAKLASRRTYSVYLRYVAGAGNAASVPVDVLTTSGVVTVNVDETKAASDPSGYVLLGQWELDPASAYVKVRTDGTRGTVTVDAVGFA
jgi:hypothetical protein